MSHTGERPRSTLVLSPPFPGEELFRWGKYDINFFKNSRTTSLWPRAAVASALWGRFTHPTHGCGAAVSSRHEAGGGTEFPPKET